MQSLHQQHLRRVLWARLCDFPVVQLQVWLQLRALHEDVAREVALWSFALPVSHPALDAWIAQIHSVWRAHFNVRECYDGVVFLPQREALLKRPVLALFQHRHVSLRPSNVRCDLSRSELWVHGLSVRFYGNPRDVERMKQRSWNVLLDASTDFVPQFRYGSVLQLCSRLPSRWRIMAWSNNIACLDRRACSTRWVDYPNHDFVTDSEDRRHGLL